MLMRFRYEQIVHGNRGDGLLFRCDDIDGNCVLPGMQ